MNQYDSLTGDAEACLGDHQRRIHDGRANLTHCQVPDLAVLGDMLTLLLELVLALHHQKHGVGTHGRHAHQRHQSHL
jgi:hypothetical protein